MYNNNNKDSNNKFLVYTFLFLLFDKICIPYLLSTIIIIVDSQQFFIFSSVNIIFDSWIKLQNSVINLSLNYS